ncbi:MAG: hypothetical protein H5T86_15080, partial [Armatimonadetes bacterium]|nr:hypothetical protein [Armatimonadota bacterium]
LTIMGGALLLNGGLVVQGGLDLAGSPDALVVLASSTSEPTPGITYSPDSSGAATWVDISGATVGITIRDASPRLDHVAAHDNQADGLFVTGARAAPVVTWSSFTRNARYGVRIEDEAQPNLGNVGNTSPMDDGYNEIHSNGAAYDLRNTSTKTIMAENNWWGADVASAIKARIWDRDENPSVGLVDIWPFLTSRPNQAPTLRWLGSAPYANAGVAPLLGSPSTVFTYKVLYSDADGDPPRYVRVHILLSGRPIEGSPFDMTQASGASDYRAGVVFEFSTKLAVGRSYTYFFEAADRSLQAVGEPTQPQDGPIVNRRPTLSWVGSSSYASDGVDPDTGYDDTEFDFRVKYTDADGDAPSGVFLYVYLNGQPVAGSPFAMTKLSGDYSAGAVYQRRLTLTQGSTSGYQYRFSASDGLEAATGEPTQFHSGPSVRWRPRLTYVASVGYERDGVEPQVAAVGTDFRFLVRYTHGGGRNPAFVRLHLQLNGQEVSGSPFDMAPADDTPVAQGRTYSVSVRVPAGRGYVHWFEASDGTLAASGPATQPAEGP